MAEELRSLKVMTTFMDLEDSMYLLHLALITKTDFFQGGFH